MASFFFSLLYNLFQVAKGVNSSFLTIQSSHGTTLQNKWIVISGSNNGVGFEAAKTFAAWGANLILACRQPPPWERHPEAATKECRAAADMQGNHSSTIEWWELDMADLASVEAFAQRWLDSGRVLDVLCNNAGVPTTSAKNITKDGFQLNHQVNLLSHVLLTLRLLPSLARSDADPRIVCTTSNLHHVGALDLDHFNNEPGMRGGDYPNNKLYFQMWVSELQARLRKHADYAHITVVGVHPGFVASGIWTELKDTAVLSRILNPLLRYVAITSQQGSLAITHAATGPRSDGGKYFNRIWEAPSRPYCHDPEARSRVWAKLDEELGLKEKGLLEILGTGNLTATTGA